MPSSIAEPLFDRLLRAFPADRAYTREDWSDDPMPEPVRYFLAQLLRHQSRLEAERLRRARSTWVDYEHPDMERSLRTFFATVEDHMRVPRSEWGDTLHQATHHVTSYLVQPTHVLGEFVFDDRSDPLPLDQVMWRMKFFGPYAYLRDAVRAYAKQREDDRLTRSVFETFLRRIDQRITAEYDADRWIRLLGPLYRLVRTATGQAAIPVDPLAIFFEEKGADDIAERIRHRSSASARLDPDELRGHLHQALPDDPSRAAGEPSPSLPDSVSSKLESSTASPARSSRSDPSEMPSTTPTEESSSSKSASTESTSAEPASTESAPAGTPAAGTPTANEPADPSAADSTSTPQSYSMEDISQASRSGSPGTSPTSEPPAETDAPAGPGDTEESGPEKTGGEPSLPADSTRDPDDEIWGVDGSPRAVSQRAGEGDSASRDDSRNGPDDDSVPLWKQFQSGQSSRAAHEEQENGSDAPLWARFQSDPDAAPAQDGERRGSPSAQSAPSSGGDTPRQTPESAPSPDAASSPDSDPQPSPSGSSSDPVAALEQSVLGERNPPQRDMYVRQLFAGSEAAYERVLRRLHEADSWSNASQIIAQDVFRKNKVNIYSDAAVRFTNAVESRFRA